MSDTIAAEKTKALSKFQDNNGLHFSLDAVVTLASKRPEQRDTALGILVNKLGDRSKAFASNVIYKLRILCKLI